MLATAGNVFLLWLCLHGNLRTRGMSYEAWVLYLRLLYIMMAGWENCKQPLKTCYLWSKDNQRERRAGWVGVWARTLPRSCGCVCFVCGCGEWGLVCVCVGEKKKTRWICKVREYRKTRDCENRYTDNGDTAQRKAEAKGKKRQQINNKATSTLIYSFNLL